MLRLATVGTGWIVEAFLEGVKHIPELNHTACYSRTPEQARMFAEKTGASQTYVDLESMAKSSDIDCVYIASPNSYHYPQSKLFLEHGKHVLCEKPCVTRPEQLKELQALAEKNGLVYMEAIMGIHLPQMKALEKAVRAISPVSLARLDYSQYSSKYPAYLAGQTPNIFNPAMGTGGLMDLGIYCVYPAIHLFGLPKQICASAQFLRTGSDGCGAILLKYPDKTVSITYSKIAQGVFGSEIHGENGVISCSLISKLEGLELRPHKGEAASLEPIPLKMPAMAYEAQSFAEYILHPEANANRMQYLSKLAREVHQVMYEIRKSAGIQFTDETLE